MRARGIEGSARPSSTPRLEGEGHRATQCSEQNGSGGGRQHETEPIPCPYEGAGDELTSVASSGVPERPQGGRPPLRPPKRPRQWALSSDAQAAWQTVVQWLSQDADIPWHTRRDAGARADGGLPGKCRVERKAGSVDEAGGAARVGAPRT